MKKALALLLASLCLAVGSGGAATIELHSKNGKAPKEGIASPPSSATASDRAAPQKSDLIVASSEKPPVVGWLAVKRGLPESELKRQLGFPRVIENRGDHELWKFVTGAVWVKEHKVVAWMQVILD